MADLIALLRAAGITDEKVLGAMERIPRHQFVPPTLIDQLAVGGIMVVPVARSAIDQRLLKLVRRDQASGGGVDVTDLGGVRFVPLVDEREDDRKRPLTKAIARLRRRP